MEYIFGNIVKDGKRTQILKTVGETHTNLSGSFVTSKEYDDTIITDSCEIVAKYHSTEDIEGNCYDWYEVLNHSKKIEISKSKFTEIHQEGYDQAVLDLIERGVL